MKTLFWIAVTGWLCSTMVNIISSAGIDLLSSIPLIWVLPIGIFVVWIPAIALFRNNDIKQLREELHPIKQAQTRLVAIIKILPKWLVVLAILSFIYMPINFVAAAAHLPGSPEFQYGHYVLTNHGRVVKIISKEEYPFYKATEARMITGHCMAFYGLAMAILFPYKVVKKTSV